MTTKTKKIVIGVSVAIALIGAYAYSKFQKLQKVFEQIDISPTGINKLDISLTRISFLASVRFTNNSNEDFNVKGYIVKLTRINFFYNGKYLATAETSLDSFLVTAKNQLELKDIPVVVPTRNLLENLMTLTNFDINKLTTEAVVSVGNYNYTIK